VKVGFISLGCPKNLVDSEVMMGQLVASGHELTPHPDQADVLVVNTCSFIDPAKKESVDTILEMAEYKKIGRASEADRRRLPGGALSRRYPQGTARSGCPDRHQRAGKHRGRLCEGAGAGPQSAGAVPLSRPHAARALHAAPFRLHQDRRGLRSSVHLLRDPAISRRVPQPALRIGDLRGHAPVPQGVREINLIGQDTTCYGEDLGLKTAWRDLLARLAQIETPREKVDPLPLRLSEQSHAALLDTIAEHAALVKYIDMPLQHASARVLKRMKRGGSGDIFLKLIERIRRTIPGRRHPHQLHRGLPGRDRADFESCASSSKAAQVRPAGRVLLFRRRHQRQLRAGWQGGRRTIYNRKRRLMARAADFGETPPRPGEMRRMKITEAHDYDLLGELTDEGVADVVEAPITVNPFRILAQTRPQTAPMAR
jgi:ribosomal protein S12 methylthiotransferase